MVNQSKRTKIAIVGYKLASGGLERVLSTLSELLHQSNCQVHVVILEDEIEYTYAGTLLNLGKYSKFEKYFKLKKYLKDNQFDFIIDFRHRINPWMELAFLNYIYLGFKTIYTVHTSNLKLHFTTNKWVARQIFMKTYKIVSVSTEMNQKIKREYQFEKGIVIPNCILETAIDFEDNSKQLSYNYCIAVGRLVAMKQFDKLIETYSKSELTTKGIHLVILGEGEEYGNLQKQIEDLKMTPFIHLLGFKKNTDFYVKKAFFLILTSEYEGFPMVILEALSVGTPVISFDCETGPNEMIVNDYNGLLVENQNFGALEKAINKMINNQQLYDFCKINAKASIASFSAEVIREKWLNLMH